MRKLYSLIVAVWMFLALPALVMAQSNGYRDYHAYIGLAPGLYGYHGLVSLNNPNNTAKTTQWRLGGALYASFPIKRDATYFRGTLGASNFATDPSLFSYSQNAFGAKPVVWFESQAVFNLTRKATRTLPYAFIGFGGLVADPLDGITNDTEVPGSGDEKPDRSVFSFPVAGLGVDYALAPKTSVFLEGTYRYHWNFFVKDGSHPFSTTFFSAGVRFALRSKQGGTVTESIPEIPQPKDIPTYEPPAVEAPPPPPVPKGCALSELNSVYFDYDSSNLDGAATSLLDENIAELKKNMDCGVRILGYTDEAVSAAKSIQISEARARKVQDYYVAKGIDPSHLKVVAMGIAQPNCNKSDPDKGCRFNRRAESKPVEQSKLNAFGN